MLCSSGFELYSRWVPLNTGKQFTSSSSFITLQLYRIAVQYSMKTYPKCDTHLEIDRSKRQVCSVQITVRVCEHKPYLVWFSCRRKSSPVQYEEHNIRF